MVLLLSEKYLQGIFYCGWATNMLHTGLGSFCIVGEVTQSSYQGGKLRTPFGSQNII